jgi:hypothetical protein
MLKLSGFFFTCLFFWTHQSLAIELVLREGLQTHLDSEKWEIFQDKTHFGGHISILQKKNSKETILYSREPTPLRASGNDPNSICKDFSARSKMELISDVDAKSLCHLKSKNGSHFYKFIIPKTKHQNVIMVHDFYIQSQNPDFILESKNLIEKMEGFK